MTFEQACLRLDDACVPGNRFDNRDTPSLKPFGRIAPKQIWNAPSMRIDAHAEWAVRARGGNQAVSKHLRLFFHATGNFDDLKIAPRVVRFAAIGFF